MLTEITREPRRGDIRIATHRKHKLKPGPGGFDENPFVGVIDTVRVVSWRNSNDAGASSAERSSTSIRFRSGLSHAAARNEFRRSLRRGGEFQRARLRFHALEHREWSGVCSGCGPTF